MNPEHQRPLLSKPFLNSSTEYSKESVIDTERLKWKSYLFKPSHSDQIRLSLTEHIYNLVQDENRYLFHLTITYKPYQDRTYTKSDIDLFFSNFYLKYLIPRVLNTRNYSRPSKRSIQPITFTFTDEHLQSFHSDRLHHHSILCVHPDTLSFFESLPEDNPIPTDTPYTHKICTSHIRPCEPMTLLYSSKMYDRYPDFLSFPDKLHKEHH